MIGLDKTRQDRKIQSLVPVYDKARLERQDGQEARRLTRTRPGNTYRIGHGPRNERTIQYRK